MNIARNPSRADGFFLRYAIGLFWRSGWGVSRRRCGGTKEAPPDPGTTIIAEPPEAAALRNEIMPNLRELIGKAGKIAPRHRELRDTHEIYVSALNAELQGFILMLSALEKKDRGILIRANEKLDEAAKEMRDYWFELDEYARSIGLGV